MNRCKKTGRDRRCAAIAIFISFVWMIVMFLPGTIMERSYVYDLDQVIDTPHNYFTGAVYTATISLLVVGVCFTNLIMEIRTLRTGKNCWGTILLADLYALHVSVILLAWNPTYGDPVRALPPVIIGCHMLTAAVSKLLNRTAAKTEHAE